MITDLKNKKVSFRFTWKRFIVTVTSVLLILIGAYAYGTFTPNKWTVKRITNELELELIGQFSKFDLQMPSISYSTPVEFVTSVNNCINFINLTTTYDKRVHRDIIIGMAILETDYGKSRFAVDGNNLFGIRTWDPTVPQLKPLELPNAKFGVKKYPTKCHSVQEMINIINRHHAYAEYRHVRLTQYEQGVFDLEQQIEGLEKWSTNPEYTALVIKSINEIENILSGANKQ